MRERGREHDANLVRASERFNRLDKRYHELRNVLAEGVYKIAENYAKRYRPENTGVDLDDLIQAGTIYGMKSVHKFDPSKKTSLLSFLTRCVCNAWLPMLRKKRTNDAAFSKWADTQKVELGWKQSHYHESNDADHDNRIYDVSA